MIRPAIIIALSVALAACASNSRPRIPDKIIDRALSRAPGEAQPSKIVSVEIAFARAAREVGQWTAFEQYAAPGAMLHGQAGAVQAQAWLASQKNPEKAVQWGPREIWMSCDATMAVSTGRFIDPDGIVGNFITVWQRQSDGEYRWVYDAGAPDDPQPPPREAPQEGDIVVTALDAVRGHVSDCRKRGEALPASPLENAAGASKDKTLTYRWEHTGEGDRRFVAYWLSEGEWQVAMDNLWPASSGG